MAKQHTIRGLASAATKGARTEVYEKVPRIELKQLRYFLAVAEHLNFTRAADQMGISQSPLSQHILALERQLDAKLFVRSRREVSLTLEGQALVPYARSLANTTRMAAELVHAITRGEEGPLTIGSIFSSIYTVIPRVLPTFTRRHPKVKVDLREMTVFEQITALKEFRIDVGICRGPIRDRNITALTLLQEPFVAVLPTGHPLGNEEVLTMEQIASQPLIRILPTANREFSHSMFAALLEQGHELNVVQEVSDMHTVIGLVAAGFGISLVPASLQAMQIAHIRYIALKEATVLTPLQMVYNADNPSRSLQLFLRVIEGTFLHGDGPDPA